MTPASNDISTPSMIGVGTQTVEPIHRECLMLSVIGHVFGVCSCTDYAGTTTTREAALELARRVDSSVPADVLASINYEVRSGAPWQRTVLFSGGTTIPTIVLPVEPLGSRYFDNLHLLDGRVRKELRLFANHRVALGVDVFNLLNKNTTTSITTQSGPNFARVTSAAGNTQTLPFLPGRNVQFTLNYSF